MTRTHAHAIASGGRTLAGLLPAAALFVLSGLAVSAGHAADKNATERSVEQSKVAERSADRSATRAAERNERRGVRSLDTVRPAVPLLDDTMTADEAQRRATEIARGLLRDRRIKQAMAMGGMTPAVPPTDSAKSSGGVIVDINDESIERDDYDWNPGSVPPIGQGISWCDTPREIAGQNLGRSFVDMSFPNRWPIMPIAADAGDIDGDGALDDPLPQRPVVIYYQFLEEAMTEIDWVGGDDNINHLGIRSSDDDGDGIEGIDPTTGLPDLDDEPDEDDGLADTWEADPGTYIARYIIPPPTLDNLDEEIAPWLALMGLGTIPWGDERPQFAHPDAEAAWRLFQRQYRTAGTFEDTFESGQVLEPEERVLFLTAFEAIERVANVIFIERSDDFGSFNNGYPFAPKGYALDSFQGILVTPGTANGDGIISPTDPEPIGDEPNFPEDDYPWILIAKGAPLGLAPGNFATTLGANRFEGFGVNALSYYGSYNDVSGSISGVFHLVDFDRDGFPDTPDIQTPAPPAAPTLAPDGFADQIILSSNGTTPTFGAPAPGNPVFLNAFDTNGDGVVTAADTNVNPATGVLEDINGAFLTFPIDLNGNGDETDEGTVDAFYPPPFGTFPIVNIHLMQTDVGGDGVADPMVATGAIGSISPHSLVSVPCELLSITQEVLDGGGIGVIVHEIMHHMGFAHEHQRPDREEFVTVDFNNLFPGFADQMIATAGGIDQYANWTNNFDITPNDPVNVPPTRAGDQWVNPTANARLGSIDNSGAADGGFEVGTPVAGGAGPPEDFDPNPDLPDDINATAAAVTGNTNAAQDLDGVSVLTSPLIFGPEDATIRFAYWLHAPLVTGPLDANDGIVVEVGCDRDFSGTVDNDEYQVVATLLDNAPEWRQVEIELDESLVCTDTTIDDADESLRDPNFRVRFTARDQAPDTTLEAAIDYVRVINPYDFLSIMHYDEFSGSINPGAPGFETIVVEEEFRVEFGNAIGQNAGLSLGDRTALRNLYGPAPVPDGQVGPDDPCRTDVNEDGFVDGRDLVLFLEWYNAQDIRADFAQPGCTDTNGDGNVDNLDDTSECIDALDLVQYFVDLQFGFACLTGDVPSGLEGNDFEPINPR